MMQKLHWITWDGFEGRGRWESIKFLEYAMECGVWNAKLHPSVEEERDASKRKIMSSESQV